MYEVGRLCVKIAGRDARKKCVVVDVLDNNYVLIDGQTRRRNCNVNHLEPLDKVLKIKKGASHKDVVEALDKEGINGEEKKSKPKKTRPKKTKKSKKTSKKEDKKSKKKKKATKSKKDKESSKKKDKKEDKKKSSKKSSKK